MPKTAGLAMAHKTVSGTPARARARHDLSAPNPQSSAQEDARTAAAMVAYHSRPLPVFAPLGKPFQELFGISRSTQAELIRKRELRSVLVGEVRGRRLIEVQSMLEYLERQRQREAAGQVGISSPNPYKRKHYGNTARGDSERIEAE